MTKILSEIVLAVQAKAAQWNVEKNSAVSIVPTTVWNGALTNSNYVATTVLVTANAD